MIMDKYTLQEEIYLMQQKLNYQINNDIELNDNVETHKEHFEFLKERFETIQRLYKEYLTKLEYASIEFTHLEE